MFEIKSETVRLVRSSATFSDMTKCISIENMYFLDKNKMKYYKNREYKLV